MRRGAVGVTVIIAGKSRGQRAKTQKYTMGYLISTGQPKKEFVDTAMRHCLMRAGAIGIQVAIMQSVERKVGKNVQVMPDFVKIFEPKDENLSAIVPGVEFAQRRDATE